MLTRQVEQIESPSPSPSSRQIANPSGASKMLPPPPGEQDYFAQRGGYYGYAYLIPLWFLAVAVGLVFYLAIRSGMFPTSPSSLPVYSEVSPSLSSSSFYTPDVQAASRSPSSSSPPLPALAVPAAPPPVPTPSPTVLSRYRLDFEEREQLGQGGFGSVYRAIKRLEGIDYAIKKVRLVVSEPNTSKIFREVRLLAKLDHPNVVRYYNSWIEEDDTLLHSERYRKEEEDDDGDDDGDESTLSAYNNTTDTYNLTSVSKRGLSTNSGIILFDDDSSFKVAKSPPSIHLKHSHSFEDIDSVDEDIEESRSSNGDGADDCSRAAKKWGTLYIQMQYCGRGTLAHYLADPTRAVRPHEIFHIFGQAVNGVAHIHANGMIHRDLKPANLLLTHDGTVRICDFGLSTDATMVSTLLKASLDMSAAWGSHTTGVGSPLYCSPEQLKGQRYDEKVDIFSMGILLYEMFQVFNTQMERAQNLGMLRSGLVDGFTHARWPALAALVLLLISPDPKDRPSAKDILAHPLYLDCKKLI